MGSPQQRISPSKESRSRQIRNPKTQENQDLPTAFLQNRILAHVKSPRRINRFRILHGRRSRPSTSGTSGFGRRRRSASNAPLSCSSTSIGRKIQTVPNTIVDPHIQQPYPAAKKKYKPK